MKRRLSIFAVILFFASINTGIASIESNSTSSSFPTSCFSFYHELFHSEHDGITLDNLGEFNDLVRECESAFG